MDNKWFDLLAKTLADSDSNRSVTENGAVGYRTTGKKLLDLNFAVSSLRSVSETEIENRFADALGEDPKTAIVWLFFARDVRQGMGERRLFRVCMRYLAREFPDMTRRLIPLVSEYGRWDDLWCLLSTGVKNDVVEIVKSQLQEDWRNMEEKKSISLLCKWLPSLNTSSAETVKNANILREALVLTHRRYRKTLVALRQYIDITERKMSAKQWNRISYEAVPSRANLIYGNAFLRHDEERRSKYLDSLQKGETKINASVLFPHDIVHKYGYRFNNPDVTLESLWQALPNTVEDRAYQTIVVADGSGSMCTPVGNTRISAWEVAHALAIYFAERLTGSYKDRYITFSSRPQLVNLSGASTLAGKLQIAYNHDECSNTNIEAVFDLILKTAVKHRLRQDEIPANILIISDMEFDDACYTDEDGYGIPSDQTLFSTIAQRYHDAGYRLPRLIFWNVNSRTNTIPVRENELGVALVSGFSPNVAKMVMSGKLDPMEVLLETLNTPRYDAVRAALENGG